MADNIEIWIAEGRHLPDDMRSPEDQEKVFQALATVAQRAVEKGNRLVATVTPARARSYVMGVFLPTMARHGYVLAKAKGKVDTREDRHLPKWMRDFHAQKDLFKALGEIAPDDAPDWMAAHAYTTDILLWAFANGGYTLQRTRKRFAFGDIEAFVGGAREGRDARSAELLLSAFAAGRGALT